MLINRELVKQGDINGYALYELKTTKFKPEYLGKLDFYLEALDRDVRKGTEYEQKLIPKDILRAHLNEYYDDVKTALEENGEE